MSPPNIARVTEVFELTFLAMNKGTDGVCAAVAKYVTGALDPGVVELLVRVRACAMLTLPQLRVSPPRG